ncbi:hypothetical protein P256_01657 [Acinetobacter nectaris CIP 110549]|uniref:BD-FAE-like domain-containing protein n=1 Tax=Acinetobacter nectaris CIP 110549 TaxID=1392540 RepID=V2T8Q7_9GAMM|nr:alpha/beta hydrolase [Acinetobacter nectaris]ESK38838.1 hypothetical protein P256_01657 [Acinetobacter nectaris CIP 110549]
MIKNYFLFICALLMTSMSISAQPINIALWPNEHLTNESLFNTNVGKQDAKAPMMALYQPTQENNKHIAILVLSGGGYAHEALNKEGTPTAKWLKKQGFTVFELLYRLPNIKENSDSRYDPFADGQRAIRIIRASAEKYGYNAHKIGVLGFSAGGHLAGILSTRWNAHFYPNQDVLDSISARPDFTALLYPVVHMEAPLNTTHAYHSLFGHRSNPSIEADFSVDEQVRPNMPPVFLSHAEDDQTAPILHSILLEHALQKAHVPYQFYRFKNGGHGWGLGKQGTDTTAWPHLFLDWFQTLQ